MSDKDTTLRVGEPVIDGDRVKCGDCGFLIYDGQVIRTRLVDVENARALCRCKSMVPIPVTEDWRRMDPTTATNG